MRDVVGTLGAGCEMCLSVADAVVVEGAAGQPMSLFLGEMSNASHGFNA